MNEMSLDVGAGRNLGRIGQGGFERVQQVNCVRYHLMTPPPNCFMDLVEVRNL